MGPLFRARKGSNMHNDNDRPPGMPIRGLIYGMILVLPFWFLLGLFIGWLIKS